MERTMTWEEAVRLVDQIAASPDSGNWHAQVATVEQGYAVAVRQHNTPTLYYVSSQREFVALCNQTTMLNIRAGGGTYAPEDRR